MKSIDFKSGKNFFQASSQILHFIFQAMGNQILHGRQDVLKRQRALELTAHHSSLFLKKLNIQVRSHLSHQDLFKQNFFMVCNHMSYLDILVLSSIQPAVFVTSVEVERSFFLGDIAKWGGSFFVDRVNHRKIKGEIETLTGFLHNRFNVFVFPEGISTNGMEVLPFKKSLFRVPFQAQHPVLPISLKYTHIDQEAFSPANCDRVCWYGEMGFAPHFLQLMGLKEVRVEVHYREPLNPQNFRSHGELAQAARASIAGP